MNEMQVFQNSEFGELGVLDVNGKPYFPAKAAAKILGYKDTTNAIKQHCKGVVKHHLPHPQNPSKEIEMNFIPEGDLYRLITHSKLPAAERFEKWVFDEVLPSIRQTGGYGSQAAMGKLVEQLTQVTASLMQVATVMATATSDHGTIEEEPRRRKKRPQHHQPGGPERGGSHDLFRPVHLHGNRPAPCRMWHQNFYHLRLEIRTEHELSRNGLRAVARNRPTWPDDGRAERKST